MFIVFIRMPHMGFYIPLATILAVSTLIGGGMLVVDSLLGPNAPSAEKETPYECGVHRPGDSRQNIRAPFFTVGLLFLLFGVEVVFLIVWAVSFQKLGWTGFVEMLVFVALLTLGLAYAWRKDALSWE